jgi:RNA polymerase sigma factor (sigma-70 family)
MSTICAALPKADQTRPRPEDHLGLARLAANEFRGAAHALGLEVEDLVNEAVLGLMRAAGRYDPGQGVQWSTFAYRCARNAVITALHRQARQRRPRQLPLDALGNELDPEDLRGHGGAGDGQDVALLLARLPARQAQVIRARFGIDGRVHTFGEIAVLLGISRQRAHELCRQALARLRRHVAKEGAAPRAVGRRRRW